MVLYDNIWQLMKGMSPRIYNIYIYIWYYNYNVTVKHFEQALFPFYAKQFPKIFTFSVWVFLQEIWVFQGCRGDPQWYKHFHCQAVVLVVAQEILRRPFNERVERWLTVANWYIGSRGRAGFPESARPHSEMPMWPLWDLVGLASQESATCNGCH